jgi:hypothetical protein
MRIGGAPFLSGILLLGVLVRLSLDSARTQNTMANIIPSQKIARIAFDLFIVFSLFCAPAIPGFSFHCDRTAADALRFNAGDLGQELATKASRIFC